MAGVEMEKGEKEAGEGKALWAVVRTLPFTVDEMNTYCRFGGGGSGFRVGHGLEQGAGDGARMPAEWWPGQSVCSWCRWRKWLDSEQLFGGRAGFTCHLTVNQVGRKFSFIERKCNLTKAE